MQALIQLQSSELATFGGDAASGHSFQDNLTGSTASFRDLMQTPPARHGQGSMAGTGQGLPDGGKFLPGHDASRFALAEDYLPTAYRERDCCLTELMAKGGSHSMDNDSDLMLMATETETLLPDALALDSVLLATTEDASSPSGTLTDAGDTISLAEAQPLAVPPEIAINLQPGDRLFGGRGIRLAAELQPEWQAREVAPADGKSQILPVIRNPESLSGAAADARLPVNVPEALGDRGMRGQQMPSTSLDTQALSEITLKPATAGQSGSSSGFSHGSFASPAPVPLTGPQGGQMATLQIGVPVTDPNWGQALSNRVTWMTGSGVHGAEIRMNPAELGPVHVKITVEEGSANIAFNAQHAVTREAIEQALPRLREMLAENGLSFGEASVSDDGLSQQRSEIETPDSDRYSSGNEDTSLESESSQVSVTRRSVSGLVDTFV